MKLSSSPDSLDSDTFAETALQTHHPMSASDPLLDMLQLRNELLQRQLAEQKRSPWRRTRLWADLASVLTLFVAVATITWTMNSGIIDMRVERLGLQNDKMEARKDELNVQILEKSMELDSLNTIVRRKNRLIAGRLDELAEMRDQYARLKKEKVDNEARLLWTIDTMRRNMPTFDEYNARYLHDKEIEFFKSAVEVCNQQKDSSYGTSLGEFIHAHFFAKQTTEMNLSHCESMNFQELLLMLNERNPELTD